MIEDILHSIRHGDAYKQAAPWIVRVIAAALLIGLGVGIFQACQGQNVTGTAYGDLEVWAGSEKCYQNATEGGVSATASWGPVSFTSNFSRRIWGNCDANAEGSFTNLESDKVNGKTREFLLLYHFELQGQSFAAGGRVFRNGVQHIWRTDKDYRYEGFPPSNSWETAAHQCFNGISPSGKEGSCPQFGYFDRAGVVLVYNPDWGRFQTSYLFYQWKGNTLPPSNFFFTAEVSPLDDWEIVAEADRDLTGVWSFDTELRRRLAGPIWLGIAAGRFGDPGWGAPGWDGMIERYAATISIRLPDWKLYNRN